MNIFERHYLQLAKAKEEKRSKPKRKKTHHTKSCYQRKKQERQAASRKRYEDLKQSVLGKQDNK